VKTIFFNNTEISIDEGFLLALDLLEQGQFLAVVEICKKIVAIEPEHFRAHHGIGLGLHRAGKSSDAPGHIRRAIEINPVYFEAYNNLGNIKRESGNLEEALELFHRGRSIRPEAPQIHYNIAITLKELGRIDEALASYREAASHYLFRNSADATRRLQATGRLFVSIPII
jgi:tetratricopeptide (TPR) repeat protein